MPLLTRKTTAHSRSASAGIKTNQSVVVYSTLTNKADYYFYRQRPRHIQPRQRKFLDEPPPSLRTVSSIKAPVPPGVEPPGVGINGFGQTLSSLQEVVTSSPTPTIVRERSESVINTLETSSKRKSITDSVIASGVQRSNTSSRNASIIGTDVTPPGHRSSIGPGIAIDTLVGFGNNHSDTFLIPVTPWDAQRLLYNEYKGAAGTLLNHLGDLLYTRGGHTGLRIGNLPKFLEYQLLANWQELVVGVIVEYREWQTQSAKDIARIRAEKEALRALDPESKSKDSDGSTTGTQRTEKHTIRISSGVSESGSVKSGSKGGRGRHAPQLHTEPDEDSHAKESSNTGTPGPKVTARKRSSVVPLVASNTGLLSVTANNRRTSRSSLASSVGSGVRGGSKIIAGHQGLPFDGISEHMSEALSDHKGVLLTTLQFVLSSKDSMEKGWVHESGSSISTFLEWAQIRLQAAIKQREESDRFERSANYTIEPRVHLLGDLIQPPLTVRSKSARTPHQTSVEETVKPLKIPQPRWSSIDAPDVWQAISYDGTTTVYYPDGQIAILWCHAGRSRTGFILNAFDNSASATAAAMGQAQQTAMTENLRHSTSHVLNPSVFVHQSSSTAGGSSRDIKISNQLACFTPDGLGAIYFSDGTPRFVSTASHCSQHDARGGLIRRFRWPISSKLPISVVIRVNPFLTFRCAAKNDMTFTMELGSGSKAIFKIGNDFDAEVDASITERDEEDCYIISGLPFLSQAAKDLVKPPKARRKNRKKDEKYQQSLSDLKKTMDMKETEPLEATMSRELVHLRKKIVSITDSWHEHYRIHLKIVQPCFHSRVPSESRYSIRNRPTKSAAAGMFSRQSIKKSTQSVQLDQLIGEKTRPITAAADVSSMGQQFDEAVMDDATRVSSQKVNFNNTIAPQKSRMHCSISPEPLPPCPVVLRSQLLLVDHSLPSGVTANLCVCRCSRVQIPQLYDLEYDFFLQRVVSPLQLVIVCVVNSNTPHKQPIYTLLENLYEQANRARPQPCTQSKTDDFRLIVYDLASAASNTGCTQPLLLRRHNVQPGICFMYMGGRLVFADFVFNGYGNTKRDLFKQICRCQSAAITNSSFALPSDFRFSYDKESRRWLSAVYGVCSPPSSVFSDTYSTISMDIRNTILKSGTYKPMTSSRLADNLPQI